MSRVHILMERNFFVSRKDFLEVKSNHNTREMHAWSHAKETLTLSLLAVLALNCCTVGRIVKSATLVKIETFWPNF